jgi:hypothetical protein
LCCIARRVIMELGFLGQSTGNFFANAHLK